MFPMKIISITSYLLILSEVDVFENFKSLLYYPWYVFYKWDGFETLSYTSNLFGFTVPLRAFFIH